MPASGPGNGPAGGTDLEIFENNFLEVMQFVFNHTTFDPKNEMDQRVLAAYKPLGVEPAKAYDPAQVAKLDGKRIREAAQRTQQEWLGSLTDQSLFDELRPRIFKPNNQTDLEAVHAVSIIGPIGIAQEEAVYPQVATTDGKQMNAMHDYVVRITKDELPQINRVPPPGGARRHGCGPVIATAPCLALLLTCGSLFFTANRPRRPPKIRVCRKGAGSTRAWCDTILSRWSIYICRVLDVNSSACD